ncbi:hypothetical protein ABPG75_001561 [Micractinium tetrahymenae]
MAALLLLAEPAGAAARAAVLLESQAPSPSPSPSAASNGSDWGAAQGSPAGSASPNSSVAVASSGGSSGGSGTPGWQTGLLTVLVAAAVVLAVATMFMLITSRLRRQRRQVLASLARIQQAEAAEHEAADLEAARRWHAATVARAMERRSRQQQGPGHQGGLGTARQGGPAGRTAGGGAAGPARPPVVVIHPDLAVGLCSREEAVTSGEGAKLGEGGAGGSDSAGGAPIPAPAPAAAPQSVAAAAAAAAGEADSATAGRSAGPDRAVAAAGQAAADDPPLPRLPMRLQRIALEFPGLGAAVLLVMPHQQGWLVWHDGSGGGPGGQRAGSGSQPLPMSSVEVQPAEEAASAPADQWQGAGPAVGAVAQSTRAAALPEDGHAAAQHADDV